MVSSSGIYYLIFYETIFYGHISAILLAELFNEINGNYSDLIKHRKLVLENRF